MFQGINLSLISFFRETKVDLQSIIYLVHQNGNIFSDLIQQDMKSRLILMVLMLGSVYVYPWWMQRSTEGACAQITKDNAID
ncbi:MAG: hypothetical protein EOO02_01235, partial [Chitinophagaceae bacterium]